MKTVNKSTFNSVKTFAIASMLGLSSSAFGSVIDDFNHAKDTNLGTPRVLITDSSSGGKTTTVLAVVDGVMQIKGDIIPGRGQPGWSSLVLPLGQMNETQDASEFDGISLRVKINHGNVSISANSTEVVNYDYHSSPVVVSSDGKFHEIKIPFESMKRVWSAQTKLNTQTLSSLSIVAFSPQKSSFDFAVDKVSFYTK